MDFQLWLFFIKKLDETYTSSLRKFSELDEEEKTKLREEYESSPFCKGVF